MTLAVLSHLELSIIAQRVENGASDLPLLPGQAFILNLWGRVRRAYVLGDCPPPELCG